MDHTRWIDHFERNRLDRPEPDWDAAMTIPRRKLKPLLKTLAQFQLGDGGGPCSLIAFNAARHLNRYPSLDRVIDLWFREEAEHSRLLGCALKRFGGEPIESHWSFLAFCLVRKVGGLRFELQALLLTELVSTAYYRVLQRHVDDPALQRMCALILRDEAGHVDFHRDRLAHANESPASFVGTLWQLQFWWCGLAAAAVLWVNHGPCLFPFGATTREFFGEVRTEITGFITRLVARHRATESAADTSDNGATVRAGVGV